MTAILLTAIVERMLNVVEIFEGFTSRHFFTQRSFPESIIRAANVSFLALAIILLILLLPALFFSLTEEWGYFESLYFCFITLTTVGLGDYTPGDGEKWLGSDYRGAYKVLCVLYFLVGLSFMILILEMCARVPEDNPSMFFSCHKPMLEDEGETELRSLTNTPEHDRYGHKDKNDSRNSKDYQLLSGEDKGVPYPSP